MARVRKNRPTRAELRAKGSRKNRRANKNLYTRAWGSGMRKVNHQ